MIAGRLDGRAAIVTGAGRGIGRAIVERLVAEGAQVAALDLDPDEVETLSGALPIVCNVADPASVSKAIAVARESFGRLDIAVNNAGIGRAAGDGSDEFYDAMAAREAEVAEKGNSKIFVDQLIHMEDDG
jgi:NAD(P)-dependent dehydrogenase (short-subunit alcohol dehydrogenase family)